VQNGVATVGGSADYHYAGQDTSEVAKNAAGRAHDLNEKYADCLKEQADMQKKADQLNHAERLYCMEIQWRRQQKLFVDYCKKLREYRDKEVIIRDAVVESKKEHEAAEEDLEKLDHQVICFELL